METGKTPYDAKPSRLWIWRQFRALMAWIADVGDVSQVVVYVYASIPVCLGAAIMLFAKYFDVEGIPWSAVITMGIVVLGVSLWILVVIMHLWKMWHPTAQSPSPDEEQYLRLIESEVNRIELESLENSVKTREMPTLQDCMDRNQHIIVGIVNGSPILGYSQVFWEQLNHIGITRKSQIPYMKLEERFPIVCALKNELQPLIEADGSQLSDEDRQNAFNLVQSRIDFSIPAALQSLLSKKERNTFESLVAEAKQASNGDPTVVLRVAISALEGIRASLIRKIMSEGLAAIKESQRKLNENRTKLHEKKARLEVMKEIRDKQIANCPIHGEKAKPPISGESSEANQSG